MRNKTWQHLVCRANGTWPGKVVPGRGGVLPLFAATHPTSHHCRSEGLREDRQGGKVWGVLGVGGGKAPLKGTDSFPSRPPAQLNPPAL